MLMRQRAPTGGERSRDPGIERGQAEMGKRTSEEEKSSNRSP